MQTAIERESSERVSPAKSRVLIYQQPRSVPLSCSEVTSGMKGFLHAKGVEWYRKAVLHRPDAPRLGPTHGR